MSNLKRKREEGEESGLDDTTSPVKSPTNASTHGADEPSPSKAPIGATNGTYKAETSPAGDSAETGDSLTILICGEEVVLKGTGGRKKRKCSRDTLILTAYKGRLARMCRADNMSSALEIYKEMQAKGIKQDLETHLMILAVCGGSPGGKDELEPGNGATQAGAARAHDTKASEGERRESGAGSAQKNSSTAADAAIQIFTELSKDPEHTLPESAYTSVIRACCLDGRADAGRETLGALTRNGGLPRLRTFSPLLEAYARENGRLQDCMSLWQEATSPPHEITMTEREYLFLIKACTAVKDVSFEEVMKEYMEDVLQPRSRAAWDVIKAWFRVAPTESPRDTGTSLGDVKECTVASSSAGSVSPVEHGKDDGPSSSPCTSSALVGQSLVESEVTDGISEGHDGAVDSSGPNPGARPDGGEAEDGAGGDEEIAVNPTKGPVESDVAVEESGGAEAAGGFRGWRVSECTVADDGTCRNCGEKLKSIELSEDDEERLRKQIEVLVCTNEERTKQWKGYCGWLERRGRSRYNVIIDGANVGYFKQNAADAGELADLKQIDWAVKKYEGEGKKPLVVLHSRHLVPRRLSSENKDILKRWKEAETIQSCAPKNNDDWYWLYAAVFAGGRVLVLTNDEMRDHHFSMLSHRSFERWKERHQTRFNFGEWEDDMREVIVEEPCVYSKRSQRSSDSWHFPLKDSPDWLCVRRGVPAESS